VAYPGHMTPEQAQKKISEIKGIPGLRFVFEKRWVTVTVAEGHNFKTQFQRLLEGLS